MKAKTKAKSMWRVIKVLFFVILLGGLGLLGYSYSGYLMPQQERITAPVDLDVD